MKHEEKIFHHFVLVKHLNNHISITKNWFMTLEFQLNFKSATSKVYSKDI